MSLFDLIPSAQAQTTGQAVPDGISTLLQGPLPMLAIIGVIFYFLVFRPQQQRAKQHKTMLGQLKRGDNVVTAGGHHGTVYRVVSDDEVIVELAEGVRVRTVRSTITAVTGKGEPRGDLKAPANDKSGDSTASATKPGRKPKAIAAPEDKAQG